MGPFTDSKQIWFAIKPTDGEGRIFFKYRKTNFGHDKIYLNIIYVTENS